MRLRLMSKPNTKKSLRLEKVDAATIDKLSALVPAARQEGKPIASGEYSAIADTYLQFCSVSENSYRIAAEDAREENAPQSDGKDASRKSPEKQPHGPEKEKDDSARALVKMLDALRKANQTREEIPVADVRAYIEIAAGPAISCVEQDVLKAIYALTDQSPPHARFVCFSAACAQALSGVLGVPVSEAQSKSQMDIFKGNTKILAANLAMLSRRIPVELPPAEVGQDTQAAPESVADTQADSAAAERQAMLEAREEFIRKGSTGSEQWYLEPVAAAIREHLGANFSHDVQKTFEQLVIAINSRYIRIMQTVTDQLNARRSGEGIVFQSDRIFAEISKAAKESALRSTEIFQAEADNDETVTDSTIAAINRAIDQASAEEAEKYQARADRQYRALLEKFPAISHCKNQLTGSPQFIEPLLNGPETAQEQMETLELLAWQANRNVVLLKKYLREKNLFLSDERFQKLVEQYGETILTATGSTVTVFAETALRKMSRSGEQESRQDDALAKAAAEGAKGDAQLTGLIYRALTGRVKRWMTKEEVDELVGHTQKTVLENADKLDLLLREAAAAHGATSPEALELRRKTALRLLENSFLSEPDAFLLSARGMVQEVMRLQTEELVSRSDEEGAVQTVKAENLPQWIQTVFQAQPETGLESDTSFWKMLTDGLHTHLTAPEALENRPAILLKRQLETYHRRLREGSTEIQELLKSRDSFPPGFQDVFMRIVFDYLDEKIASVSAHAMPALEQMRDEEAYGQSFSLVARVGTGGYDEMHKRGYSLQHIRYDARGRNIAERREEQMRNSQQIQSLLKKPGKSDPQEQNAPAPALEFIRFFVNVANNLPPELRKSFGGAWDTSDTAKLAKKLNNDKSVQFIVQKNVAACKTDFVSLQNYAMEKGVHAEHVISVLKMVCGGKEKHRDKLRELYGYYLEGFGLKPETDQYDLLSYGLQEYAAAVSAEIGNRLLEDKDTRESAYFGELTLRIALRECQLRELAAGMEKMRPGVLARLVGNSDQPAEELIRNLREEIVSQSDPEFEEVMRGVLAADEKSIAAGIRIRERCELLAQCEGGSLALLIPFYTSSGKQTLGAPQEAFERYFTRQVPKVGAFMTELANRIGVPVDSSMVLLALRQPYVTEEGKRGTVGELCVQATEWTDDFHSKMLKCGQSVTTQSVGGRKVGHQTTNFQKILDDYFGAKQQSGKINREETFKHSQLLAMYTKGQLDDVLLKSNKVDETLIRQLSDSLTQNKETIQALPQFRTYQDRLKESPVRSGKTVENLKALLEQAKGEIGKKVLQAELETAESFWEAAKKSAAGGMETVFGLFGSAMCRTFATRDEAENYFAAALDHLITSDQLLREQEKTEAVEGRLRSLNTSAAMRERLEQSRASLLTLNARAAASRYLSQNLVAASVQYGVVAQLPDEQQETQVKQLDAERASRKAEQQIQASVMRTAQEHIKKRALKKSDALYLSMQSFVGGQNGGGNPAVQAVAAEFLLTQAMRGLTELEIAALEQISDDDAQEVQAQAKADRDAPAPALEAAPSPQAQEDALREKEALGAARITSEGKAEQKQLKKLEKGRKKQERKAAAYARKALESPEEFVAAAGTLYSELLVVCRQTGIPEARCAWMFSNLVSLYGEQLPALAKQENGLTKLAIQYAFDFAVDSAHLDEFTALAPKARKHPETAGEYSDRLRLLMLKMSALKPAEFGTELRTAAGEFDLYCGAVESIKQSVLAYCENLPADRRAAVTGLAQERMVKNLCLLLRQDIAEKKLISEAAVSECIRKNLSNDYTAELLAHNGYQASRYGYGSQSDGTGEQNVYTAVSRATFESVLGGNAMLFGVYEKMPVEEKSVFLAVLSNSAMWQAEEDSSMLSSEILSAAEKDSTQETQAANLILRYAVGETALWKPDDYGTALNRLCGLRGVGEKKWKVSLKQAVSALKIFLDLKEAHRAHLPVDEKLFDQSHEAHLRALIASQRKSAAQSGNEGTNHHAEERYEALEKALQVTGLEGFRDYLKMLLEQHTEVLGKVLNPDIPIHLKKAIQYSSEELTFLASALQNRSALDFVKIKGQAQWKSAVEFAKQFKYLEKRMVDPAARQNLMEQYARADVSALAAFLSEDSTVWRQAALTLISYQVSTYTDAGEMDAAHPERFLVDSGRKSIVDGKLLSSALLLTSRMTRMETRAVKMQNIGRSIINPKAKVLAAELEKPDFGEKEFLEQLETEAEKDGEALTKIGVMSLNREETTLLLNALADRSLLDVSKEGIGRERWGLKSESRDFIGQEKRGEMMQCFAVTGRVAPTEAQPYRAAFEGLLTARVYDDGGARQQKYAARGTGIDWKLLRGGLQFVYHCGTMRKNIRGRREIERTFHAADGDMEFLEDASFFATNQHLSGNRLSHGAGRLLRDQAVELIPSYLRDNFARLAVCVSNDPALAEKLAESGLMSEDAAGKRDEHQEKNETLGKDAQAEVTQEQIQAIFSEGQQTIFSKIGDAGKAFFTDMIQTENLGDTAETAVEKVAAICEKTEGVDLAALGSVMKGSGLAAAFQSYQAQRAQFEAAVAGDESIKRLSDEIGGYSSVAGDAVGMVVSMVDMGKIAWMEHEVNQAHERSLGQMDALAQTRQTNSTVLKDSLLQNTKALKAASTMTKSQKMQDVMDRAINIASAFVDAGPGKIVGKLVDFGFSALKELAAGLVNYFTSISSLNRFIDMKEFDRTLDAAGARHQNLKPDFEKIKGVADNSEMKRTLWMSLHGMDKEDAISFMGKESAYALKFSVSGSCKIPYLKSMSTLLLAFLGFSVSGGGVDASERDIFGALLGKR